MSGVRPLSREAYETLDLAGRQAEVLAALKRLHGQGLRPDDRDLALVLGWPINCVTPRRGELVERQLIFRAGWKRNRSTGRRCAVWEPVLTGTQLEMLGGRDIDFG